MQTTMMRETIPSDLRAVGDAYSMHIRSFTRYWTLAAAVAVLSFTAAPSDGVISLFGLSLNAQNFYPVCSAFGAALNFAYCICHLQAYRSGEIFREYLAKINAAETPFAGRYSLLDAAHQLYPSGINRVYPVIHFLPSFVKEKHVKALKLPVDLFVFATPISGSVYSCLQVGATPIGFALWILLVPSTLMSLVLIKAGIRWLLFTKQ